MIEGIINTLNLTLQATGRINKRYCLSELRTSTGDNPTTVPYSFEGNGELKAININSPSLSWWRVTSPFSVEEVTTTSAVNKKQGNYSLRLVVMYRRKESTADNGFTPAWLAEDLSSVLTQSNGDLKTALQAAEVRVNVNSADIDTTKVWNEEFQDLEFKDPKYDTCLVALELSVTVIARSDCWETECNYDTDILHIFDFCDQGVFDRLTATQVACLTTALCGSCDDVTVQINGVTIATPASGDTYDVQIHDSLGADVGTAANPSVVSDTTIQNDAGDWTDTEVAEGTYTLGLQRVVDSDGSNVDTVDYKPVADGAIFTCTPCVDPPSLSVALSSSTADFGDVITITATPTDITPTAYRFYAQGTNETIFLAEQASNVYAWTVQAPDDDFDIYVEATDGTLTAYTDTPQTLTVTGLFFDQWTDFSFILSLEQEYYDFEHSIMTVSRVSDGTEFEIFFDNYQIDQADLVTKAAGSTLRVVTWTVQGTSANIVYQFTGGSQPEIVQSGTVVTENGKLAVDFNGSTHELEILIAPEIGTAYTVAANDAITNVVQVVLGGTGTRQIFWGGTSGGVSGIGVNDGSTGFDTVTEDTDLHLASVFTDAGANDGIYVDEGADSTTGALTPFEVTTIGNRPSTAFRLDGKICGIFISPDDNWANRTAQEAYLANKYGL